ncbi:MAG: hypothetical protein GY787_18210 [Alteromonadales bacterium]|nr:hypothetical protein [Alteromonadales bacterium]
MTGKFNIKPYYPTKVTPVYERDMADDPAVGRTLKNGVIIMDKDLSPAMRTETHSHEETHVNQMKYDGFNWDDNSIYFKGKKYPKRLFLEGKGPWEGPAYRNEIKAT